ncbi:SDR family oxidoreductase [Pseudonocardia sp. CA-107938]|uniref:SDR family oxidoreductase n=1 Tax=Pseudonocardia sp. CA-107938 TaxID=3240021 RepID=UPI003D91B476
MAGSVDPSDRGAAAPDRGRDPTEVARAQDARLAVELGPSIRVNAVAPTFMDTPFWRDLGREQFEQIRAGFVQQVPLRRLATIEEVASAYLYLMSATFVTGQVLAVDGGVAAAI